MLARSNLLAMVFFAAILGVVVRGVVVCSGFVHAVEPMEADFARDIRPILSDHCFACHGPDEHERQADLRLDTEEGIATVVAAGDLDESELIRRLHTEDSAELMPPPEFNKPLSGEQKRLLEAWVLSGGEFQGHWAFRSPSKPDTPPSSNAIDFLIDRKALAIGLELNGVADDAKLLRRVCLDLTGLPPTREQIGRIADGTFDYGELVDELIDSPAFGQHFGRHWLDLVRYADTHGLHLDNYREMWPYRDWVIDAFNANMPFNQFVIEQLAGDLLPEATVSQKIASGFNRLNVTTSEGGSIYEEVFARNVIDRTDAFGTIFLGMTTQCAVCHDHKFDPISQKEYYSLSAFFNSLDGRALDENKKDPAPVIRVPTVEQREQIAELDQEIAEVAEEMRQPIESVDAEQAAWEQRLALGETAPSGEHLKSSDGFEFLVPSDASAKFGTKLLVNPIGSVIVSGDIGARDVHTVVAALDEKLAGGNWQTLQLDVLPEPKTQRAGVSDNGNALLTEIRIDTRHSGADKISDDAEWMPLKIEGAKADIEQKDGNFSVSQAIDGRGHNTEGWAVAGHQIEGGRQAWFSIPGLAERIREGHDEIRVRLEYMSMFAKHQFYGTRFAISEKKLDVSVAEPIVIGPLHTVGPFPVESSNPGIYRKFGSQQREFKSGETFKYGDKVFTWKRCDDWSPIAVQSLPVDGESVAVNLIHIPVTTSKKETIDLLLGTSDTHVIYLNSKRVALDERRGPMKSLAKTYRLDLQKGPNDLYIKTVSMERPARLTYAFRSPAIALPDSIVELVRQKPDQRTSEESESIRTYYRVAICDHPEWRALESMRKGAEKLKETIESEIATTLVWKELDQPRQAHVLVRGQYDQPGAAVARDVPNFLPPMSDDFTPDRLGLARWLVQPEHPLTSRVAANRLWQIVFGTGLVRSSEDFGSQGEPPSHPELLDWLAVEFVESGWDVKRLVRKMVTSAAYRRDATIDASQLKLDPENRYLARGPRHRLDGEVLRDQALSLAGLLNPQEGGPSIKPPQPAGLWYAVGYTRSNTATFKADPEPEKQRRRSVYIFWKRTSAPPQMSTFDAPSRESCTARRERTNTPLQALLLMNEQQYLQAAKGLAARALTECDLDEPADRLAWLFTTVTARSPKQEEVLELVSLLEKLLVHYRDNPDEAPRTLSVDSSTLDLIDPPTHAAWMMVASTLLNLDEVVNK